MEHLRNYLQASKARKDNPPRDASQIGNLLHEVFDKMSEQCAMREKKVFFHTGFSVVDEIIEGLEPGELATIGGMPKSGKTAFALHIAIEVAKEKQKSVLIYSAKHSPHQITKRMLAMLTGISIRSIEDARLTDTEWSNLSTACSWLREQDIRVQGLGMPVEELCELLRSSEVPALLVLDDALPDDLNVDVITALKQFAAETKCCVLTTSFYHVGHQYVAGGADKVFFLYGYEEQSHTDCEITWNRYGRNGDTTLYFNRECLFFSEKGPEIVNVEE